MLEILIVILPVFLLIATGYGAVATGWLGATLSDHLNAFAVRLAVPVLLFQAMTRLDLRQAFDIPMLAAFYSGAVACFILGATLARLVWKRRPGEAVAVGFTAMFSNTVLIGLPVLGRAYGEEALIPALGIVALHPPLIYTIGITVMELSRRDGQSLAQTAAATFSAVFANPLMIGILAGLAFNLTGLSMPAPLAETFDMLAAAAIPVALVGIGAAMTRYRVKTELSESLMVSAVSLLVHPAVTAIMVLWLFEMDAVPARAAIILAAMPPGMNGYIFAVLYNRAVGLSASAILIATSLAVATLTGWLLLVRMVFPL